MKILNLGVGTMIWRLHIMSALVVTLGFLGFMYIGIILGMAFFLATLMGLKWQHVKDILHLDKSRRYELEQRHHPIHH